jgi:hypothetical protein
VEGPLEALDRDVDQLDRRKDQETDDKKRVWFTIVFVPTHSDGPYGKTTNYLSGREGANVLKITQK